MGAGPDGAGAPLYLPVQPLQVVGRPHVQAHLADQYHRGHGVLEAVL